MIGIAPNKEKNITRFSPIAIADVSLSLRVFPTDCGDFCFFSPFPAKGLIFYIKRDTIESEKHTGKGFGDKMDSEMKFRSTLGGGYKKEDVNAYIAAMQAEFTGIEETLKNTINHQKEELDVLRGDIASTVDLRASLDAAAARCELLASERDAANEALQAEQQAHAAAVAAMADTALKLKETEERLAEAEARLVAQAAMGAVMQIEDAGAPAITYPEDYEALKLKAEQYDRMSAHVGAIMLKANANAEDLMQKARVEAETMLSGVNAELSEARVKAQGAADTIIADIHNCVSDINTTCREDIAIDLDEIRSALTAMMDTVGEKYAEIEKKLSFAKDEMNNAAKELINRNTAQRVLKK